MWLMILKWICFILVCTDVVAYIIGIANKPIKESSGSKLGSLVGLFAGIAARVFVLYGALTCWLLA